MSERDWYLDVQGRRRPVPPGGVHDRACAACGMGTWSGEWHPWIACAAFEATRSSSAVRANLYAAAEFAQAAEGAVRAPGVEELEQRLEAWESTFPSHGGPRLARRIVEARVLDMLELELATMRQRVRRAVETTEPSGRG